MCTMLFSRHFPKLYKSPPPPPSLASWYSLSPNSQQTSNIIAQEKLSTQADRNGWSNRFAHVVRHVRGIGEHIDEDEVLRIEQTYPWPPTEKDTVASLVNFNVSTPLRVPGTLWQLASTRRPQPAYAMSTFHG